MKFAFGMFVISRPDEINQVRCLEDLMERYDAGDATEGLPDFDQLDELNLLMSGEKAEFLRPMPSTFVTESKLFCVTRSFRDLLAAADNDRVSQVAADWAESKPWRDTGVNSMDLWGMFLSLSAVCAKARLEDKELYLLVTN
jgi:hypothetical protein